jgi:hypothetical protein
MASRTRKKKTSVAESALSLRPEWEIDLHERSLLQFRSKWALWYNHRRIRHVVDVEAVEEDTAADTMRLDIDYVRVWDRRIDDPELRQAFATSSLRTCLGRRATQALVRSYGQFRSLVLDAGEVATLPVHLSACDLRSDEEAGNAYGTLESVFRLARCVYAPLSFRPRKDEDFEPIPESKAILPALHGQDRVTRIDASSIAIVPIALPPRKILLQMASTVGEVCKADPHGPAADDSIFQSQVFSARTTRQMKPSGPFSACISCRRDGIRASTMRLTGWIKWKENSPRVRIHGSRSKIHVRGTHRSASAAWVRRLMEAMDHLELS